MTFVYTGILIHLGSYYKLFMPIESYLFYSKIYIVYNKVNSSYGINQKICHDIFLSYVCHDFMEMCQIPMHQMITYTLNKILFNVTRKSPREDIEVGRKSHRNKWSRTSYKLKHITQLSYLQ